METILCKFDKVRSSCTSLCMVCHARACSALKMTLTEDEINTLQGAIRDEYVRAVQKHNDVC